MLDIKASNFVSFSGVFSSINSGKYLRLTWTTTMSKILNPAWSRFHRADQSVLAGEFARFSFFFHYQSLSKGMYKKATAKSPLSLITIARAGVKGTKGITQKVQRA